MILTIGGIKGGSGKTTIATNLAIMRATQGKDVLLVDADEQETASDFGVLRNEIIENFSYKLPRYTTIKLTGPSVRTEILKISQKYQDVIIDTGGRDSSSQRAALTVSDKLLVPFVPRSFDIWTLEKVSGLVSEILIVNPKLKASAFINRGDAKGNDNEDTKELLMESPYLQFVDIVIRTRKAFGNAASKGVGVKELKPSDEKASHEIDMLYKYIFNTK